MQAHLIGGIPEAEVQARAADFARFGMAPAALFRPERPGYLAFCDAIAAKPAIKAAIEADPALRDTLVRHCDILEAWWAVAREDFSGLHNGKKMPEVRHELLTTLKDRLIPLGCPRRVQERRGLRELVAADPLRPEDDRLHRLAPCADSRRIPHRRILPGRSRRDRSAGGRNRRGPGRTGRGGGSGPGGGRLRAGRGRDRHRRRHQEGPQGPDRRPQG